MELDIKMLDSIGSLSEENLEKACSLLDYGPSNRTALLHFCLENNVITKEQYECLLENYPLVVYQNPKQQYIDFYNYFLDKIGLTNEVYQKYSKRLLPEWKRKVMEEYSNAEGKQYSIDSILSNRDELISFDMWFLLSIRPFDIEAVCNENGYCYYVCSVPDNLDYVLDYEFFEDKLKRDLGSMGEANHALYNWMIEQIPELKGKIYFDTSDGIVFTAFSTNIKEEELDYSNDCFFKSDICYFIADDLNVIKEIAFYVSRLYLKLEKEYEENID